MCSDHQKQLGADYESRLFGVRSGQSRPRRKTARESDLWTMQTCAVAKEAPRFDGSQLCQIHQPDRASRPRRFLGTLVWALSHDGPRVRRSCGDLITSRDSGETEYGVVPSSRKSVFDIRHSHDDPFQEWPRGNSTIRCVERNANCKAGERRPVDGVV